VDENSGADNMKAFLETYSKTSTVNKRDFKTLDKEAQEKAELEKKFENRSLIQFESKDHFFDSLENKRNF